jgi:hypothetical protein
MIISFLYIFACTAAVQLLFSRAASKLSFFQSLDGSCVAYQDDSCYVCVCVRGRGRGGFFLVRLCLCLCVDPILTFFSFFSFFSWRNCPDRSKEKNVTNKLKLKLVATMQMAGFLLARARGGETKDFNFVFCM